MIKDLSQEPAGYPLSASVQPIPLLAAKLFMPPLRALLVPRPQLVARLDQGLSRPLTLISAPAGSGKTTLAGEWRMTAGKDVRLAWLSLDRDDNDPALFLAYLLAALRTVKPDLSDPFPRMLTPVQAQSYQSLLANLLNDLEEFPDRFVLALDDYHLITNSEVHAAMTYLIGHLPPRMHILILTQTDPPLPLARLRARDQVTELRAVDLRFNSEEAEAFFHQSMGLNLSAAEVGALAQHTEGWVAGMQLAGLALQTAPAGAEAVALPRLSVSGSHPFVAEYLSAEVLSRQPDDIRDFLLDTSILDRLTADLCDFMLERADSLSMLRRLEQGNLFLIPLDGERKWYRYHQLFAELLRNQLRERSPDRLSLLHRRAADWYNRHDFASEAVAHALAAGDLQLAAAVIEQNAISRLVHGDIVTLANWLDAAAPVMAEHPWLWIYKSWALLITGEIDAIDSLLQTAEEWAAAHGSNSESQDMGYHIAAIRAFMAGRRGRHREAVELMQRALERVPEGETAIRSIILLTLGDACLSLGDLDEARGALEELNRSGSGSPVNLLALSSLGVLYAEQGELHQAAGAFQNVISLSQRADERKQPVASVACLGLAGLAYEWNHLDASEKYANEALDLGERWGHPETLANSHLIAARVRQARGDLAGAFESLRRAEDLARNQEVTPWTEQRIAAFDVRLNLAQGNLDAAVRWAREHPLDTRQELSYSRQTEYVTKARVLLAQQQPEAALDLLDQLLDRFGEQGQVGRTIELLLLTALALAAAGETGSALSPLGRALAMGESENYARIFLDEGEPLMDLLRHAGSRGIAPKFAARLLAESDAGQGLTRVTRQPLIEPLTDREMEVLRLVAAGFSNQEIADRLVLALGTVKTHTASLYRKLDVSTRTQAVARATELGLL